MDEPSAPSFRAATLDDLPAIVAMLADDPLGAQRERLSDPLPTAYTDAFAAIDGDLDNELIVATIADAVVGVMQLTFIPGLSHQGALRCQVESVRVHSGYRSHGIGGRLIEWSIARARERGCLMVQLTSDKSRTDARRFYERIGFVASHEGMKLRID